MHDLHALFDAMDADGLLTIYVTVLTGFTVIVLVQLGQMAWSSVEPYVFRLVDFGKECAREVTRYMAAARARRTRTRSALPVGRVGQGTTAADLARRVRRRYLEVARGSRPMWLGARDLGDFNHDDANDWPIARNADCQSQGVVTPQDAA